MPFFRSFVVATGLPSSFGVRVGIRCRARVCPGVVGGDRPPWYRPRCRGPVPPVACPGGPDHGGIGRRLARAGPRVAGHRAGGDHVCAQPLRRGPLRPPQGGHGRDRRGPGRRGHTGAAAPGGRELRRLPDAEARRPRGRVRRRGAGRFSYGRPPTAAGRCRVAGRTSARASPPGRCGRPARRAATTWSTSGCSASTTASAGGTRR